jgi:pimeloyl-ACP methyl ester carboxylesterase
VTKSKLMMPLAMLTMAVATACAPEFGDDDQHFYVTHEGVSMPVWVTGNWRSDRMLVHVHGGPGTTNGIYWQKSSYQDLADDVGIVYYEQRASGSSHGHHRDRINVAQFVEDLDVVMTVLEHRYPDAEFVLSGHSWGGFLGSAYLLDPARQARFRGWIEQDGAHDSSCRSWQWSADWVLDHAAAVLADNTSRKEKKYWRGAQDFYADVWRCDVETEENNQIEEHDGKLVHLWHSLYVRAAGGYDVDTDRVLDGRDTRELIFESQFDLIAVTKNSPLPMKDYYGVDLTPRLGEITIPSMVLWGTHDIITPWINAKPAYEALGAAPEDKRLVLFEDSGHNPWAEEPERFYDAVHGFLTHVWPDLP